MNDKLLILITIIAIADLVIFQAAIIDRFWLWMPVSVGVVYLLSAVIIWHINDNTNVVKKIIKTITVSIIPTFLMAFVIAVVHDFYLENVYLLSDHERATFYAEVMALVAAYGVLFVMIKHNQKTSIFDLRKQQSAWPVYYGFLIMMFTAFCVFHFLT